MASRASTRLLGTTARPQQLRRLCKQPQRKNHARQAAAVVLKRELSSTRAASASLESFDARSYMPAAQFSTPNVKSLLSRTILHEISPEEAATRVELAACYLLFEVAGWNENIYNHLTAKVDEPDGSESFLINPFGLKYSEVTASSLIKVRHDGSVINPGVTGDVFGINDAGFVIHSAIHAARKDLKSIMHCHYPTAAGVSAVKSGLMELTQTVHQVGPVAYHDYHGIVVDRDEQKSLVQDMGPDKNIMFLRNHGVITAGESVCTAWYSMYQLLKATDIVTAAGACSMGDKDNILTPSEETVEKTFDVMRNKAFSGAKYGVKELSAYMRWLDSVDMGYRT